MFVLSPAVIALMVCVPLLGFFVGKWLLQKDTEKENRRKAANRMASALRNVGLKRMPELLECYAVGDWSGIAKQVQTVGEMLMQGENVVLAEVDTVFMSVLSAKLNTEAGRALLAAKLAEVSAPVTVANVSTP
jgi:hypothetical protein